VHMLPMQWGNISIYSQSNPSVLVISCKLVPDPVSRQCSTCKLYEFNSVNCNSSSCSCMC
jgi:hypothetical protein